MNYVVRLKAGGRVGCGMQRIASSKLQCKLIREYTWGSSLKVSGEGESKKNWNFAKLTCLVISSSVVVVVVVYHVQVQCSYSYV